MGEKTKVEFWSSTESGCLEVKHVPGRCQSVEEKKNPDGRSQNTCQLQAQDLVSIFSSTAKKTEREKEKRRKLTSGVMPVIYSVPRNPAA